jgi:hypothetical protein
MPQPIWGLSGTNDRCNFLPPTGVNRWSGGIQVIDVRVVNGINRDPSDVGIPRLQTILKVGLADGKDPYLARAAGPNDVDSLLLAAWTTGAAVSDVVIPGAVTPAAHDAGIGVLTAEHTPPCRVTGHIAGECIELVNPGPLMRADGASLLGQGWCSSQIHPGRDGRGGLGDGVISGRSSGAPACLLFWLWSASRVDK